MKNKLFYVKINMVIYMNIVFKVSDNVKDKMIKYYEDKRKPSTPPYAVFQAVKLILLLLYMKVVKLCFKE